MKVGPISMKNRHLDTTSKSIKVHWITLSKMPDNGFGHGVEFYVKQKAAPRNIRIMVPEFSIPVS